MYMLSECSPESGITRPIETQLLDEKHKHSIPRHVNNCKLSQKAKWEWLCGDKKAQLINIKGLQQLQPYIASYQVTTNTIIMEHHRPGPLKQKNKKHNSGKHRTKGQLEKVQKGMYWIDSSLDWSYSNTRTVVCEDSTIAHDHSRLIVVPIIIILCRSFVGKNDAFKLIDNWIDMVELIDVSNLNFITSCATYLVF